MAQGQNLSNSSSSAPPPPLSSALLTFIIFLSVFEIIILVGNGFVVYLVSTRKRLHTNTNWLVLSLAVSDLVVALAIIPSRIACFQYKCDEILMKILYDIFIFVSLCNLCCLTLDRFIAVMRPLKYQSTVTHSLVVKLIIASWVIPTAVFCIPLVWTYGYSEDVPLQRTANKIFYLTQIILFMCVPCIAMFIAYACILRMALTQARRIQDLEQSIGRGHAPGYSAEAKNTIKVFGIVFLMFVFCWILSAYRTFTTFFQLGVVPPQVTMTSRLLLLFNSCVNPIVYALWKKDFRSELKKVCCNSCGSQRDHAMERRGHENPACGDKRDESSTSKNQQSQDTALEP